MFGPYKNIHHVINSSERSDILVFNSYLCHVRFLLTFYVCSTKIGEISDISKCFENFVSQILGVLTRIYAAELRWHMIKRNIDTISAGILHGSGTPFKIIFNGLYHNK